MKRDAPKSHMALLDPPLALVREAGGTQGKRDRNRGRKDLTTGDLDEMETEKDSGCGDVSANSMSAGMGDVRE